MSQKSNKVKKLYQKYKVDGGDSGEDDDWRGMEFLIFL